MGTAGTYSETSDTPQTCCTTCRTVFEVSPELLASSDTRVRCGECLSIFDALENLRDPADRTLDAGDLIEEDLLAGDDDATDHGLADEDEVAELASLADETGSLDVTYSDFDLFSGDAELPEVAYLDETADTPEFDFDTVEDEEEDAFGDTLFAPDPTAGPAASGDATDGANTATRESSFAGEPDPDFVDDDEPVEPLVFEYRDAVARGAGSDATGSTVATSVDTEAAAHADARAASGAGGGAALAEGAGDGTYAPSPSDTRPSGSVWPIAVLMVFALGVLLAGLHGYRERGNLHNDPLARPVLLGACRVVGCTVPSRVDLASLELLERKVFTHPREPAALVINVAFRNTAAFDQRYPVLVVRLRDRLGRVVAERDFAPEDYLGRWASGDTLEAGRRLDISLAVGDPGDGAENYEFEFREAAG